ncbi:MAG: hypothetical protein H7Y86_17230 [Rhizobacter sp.]|nr:hypothetical protein [Ferruginibacter sp.]
MGKFEKGILGGFSGKVGTVIGGNWKGIDYMRSRSRKRKFIATDKQLAVQIRFGLATKFANSMGKLLQLTFKDYAVEQTGINSCVSYILKDAIIGIFPDFSISYPNVLVSRGDLPNVLAPTAVAAAGSMVNFSWTNNSGVGIAKPTDKAILVAYCPEMNGAIYTTGSAARSALTDELNLAGFTGKPVETYIGFISEDGLNIARSLYTGQVTVS